MAQWLKSTLISLEEVGMRVQIPAWQLPFFFSFIVFLPFGFLLFILTATLLASRDFCENVFLVYIRFIDKHYITFCSIASISNAFYAKLCSSWRGIKTRVERQTTTNSHVRVRHRWKTCSFNSFRASVSNLNHHIFSNFLQRRSFLSSCYHLNLNQAFKVKNLVPMTMHHGRCHWTCAL